MENFFEELSLEEITNLEELYKDNPGALQLVEAAKEMRLEEDKRDRIKAEFKLKVAKLAKLPAPPEGIHNISLRWASSSEPTGEEDVEVEVMVEGLKVKEMRTPMKEVWGWVVETNKTTTRAAGQTSKGVRAVTISKREGNQLTPVESFSTAREACKYLKLEVGADSATRVLTTNGYLVDKFEGSLVELYS